MTYEIPPLKKPEDMPLIKTQDDLCQAWRALMGELGFAQRQMWLMFIEPDGTMMPALSKFEDLDPLPDREYVGNFVSICRQVVRSGRRGSSFAVLYARPGRKQTTAMDRSWAREVTECAERLGVKMWPMHLANDHDLRVFAPDELIAA
ncbi:hypothetical protein BH09ACT10_BH09ACT10_19140 [soil metagenome]